MKRLLISLFLIVPLIGHSQIEKGTVLINLEGSYQKMMQDFGVTTNYFASQVKGGSISPSIGYFISDHFIIGAGVEYSWGNEERMNNITLHNTDETRIQIEGMDIKSNLIMPKLYLGYYQQVVNRLYLATIFQLGYGKINTEYTTSIASMTSIPTDIVFGYTLPNSLKSIDMDAGYDYFASSISPELSYFISKSFSFSIKLGGMNYEINDWDNDLSSFKVDFNPNNWVFGFKLVI